MVTQAYREIASNTWRRLPCRCDVSERWIIVYAPCVVHSSLIPPEDLAPLLDPSTARSRYTRAYGPVPFGG